MDIDVAAQRNHTAVGLPHGYLARQVTDCIEIIQINLYSIIMNSLIR